MLYKSLNELISVAFNELRKRPDADMSFIESIQAQYRDRGTLSPRQITALENIAGRELDRRREMQNNLPLFE